MPASGIGGQKIMVTKNDCQNWPWKSVVNLARNQCDAQHCHRAHRPVVHHQYNLTNVHPQILPILMVPANLCHCQHCCDYRLRLKNNPTRKSRCLLKGLIFFYQTSQFHTVPFSPQLRHFTVHLLNNWRRGATSKSNFDFCN